MPFRAENPYFSSYSEVIVPILVDIDAAKRTPQAANQPPSRHQARAKSASRLMSASPGKCAIRALPWLWSGR
jgi:hypothetical protein